MIVCVFSILYIIATKAIYEVYDLCPMQPIVTVPHGIWDVNASRLYNPL